MYSTCSACMYVCMCTIHVHSTKLGELLAEIGSWIKAMTHFVNGKNSLISIEVYASLVVCRSNVCDTYLYVYVRACLFIGCLCVV